jgi:hypothetical protein
LCRAFSPIQIKTGWRKTSSPRVEKQEEEFTC